MFCKFCNREIKNKGSLVAHQNVCKCNPNRIKYKHSPLAGAPKGVSSPLKGKKTGRLKYWDNLFPDHKIFSETSTYPRHSLRARILERKLLPYICTICNILPLWCGKPMPLILDHINGINNDNRLCNLRFICSNCDTQLPTYKSKNKKKKEDTEVGSSTSLEN